MDSAVNYKVRTWICAGTTSSRFDRPILGTLAPLAGLSQLQTLNLSGALGHRMKFEGQILNLYGHNQGLTGLVETGDLQPLQNLNLLTYLNLERCYGLTGQSVSEFVWEQPGSHGIGGNR